MQKSVSVKYLVILFSVFLSACSVIPESIESSPTVLLTDFESLHGKNQVQAGLNARWGGEIISVNNLAKYSEIEVLYYPNNSYGKPMTNTNSPGRFIAKVDGFVDPLVFEEGRLLTILGEVVQPQSGVIGEQNYLYPVISAEGYHLWKQTEEVQLDTFIITPFDLRWRSPRWHRYHWLHSGFPIRDSHRVTVKDSLSGRSDKVRPVRSSQKSDERSKSIKTDTKSRLSENGGQ